MTTINPFDRRATGSWENVIAPSSFDVSASNDRCNLIIIGGVAVASAIIAHVVLNR